MLAHKIYALECKKGNDKFTQECMHQLLSPVPNKNVKSKCHEVFLTLC